MADLMARHVRCLDIEGENYCTNVGFTPMQPGDPQWRQLARQGVSTDASASGDVSLSSYLQRIDALDPAEQAEREATELANAREKVGYLLLLDHVTDSSPIPAGFFDRYQVLGTTEGSAQAAAFRNWAATGIDPFVAVDVGVYGVDSPPPYPPADNIMLPTDYREQVKSIYCGPATLQMIDGADDGGFQTQQDWASCGDGDLCTDVQGATAIGDIVRLTNSMTSWDNYVGAYVTRSMVGQTSLYYFNAHKTHIGVGHGAPIIEHDMLYKKFFGYLHYDHGGHFQVGRGYNTYTNTVNIFEPYDEQDWRSGGYHTGMPQAVDYTQMYLANHQYVVEGTPSLATIGL